MASVGRRSVAFDVPQPGAFAVQLKLTPALLEALVEDNGQATSICFGASQQGAITVGGTAFPFRTLPEGSCDLLRLPATGAATSARSAPSSHHQPATLIGTVHQKLMVQRNIEDERGRVRARAEEAERRGHERGAVLLDSGKGSQAVKSGKAGKTTTTIQRTTPPPPAGQQQPQRQPQQVTAAMLAPGGRPPTYPASQHQRARSATPSEGAPALPAATAAAAAAPRPMHKAASTGKLGQAAGAGAAAKHTASPWVLQAARSGGSLRLVLIAMLSERKMGPGTVKSVLADVAARVRAFKAPGKLDLERVLKQVAEYKTPGVYVVWKECLKELDALPPAVLAPAGGRASSPQDGSGQSGEAPPAKKRQSKAAAAGAAGAAAPGDGRVADKAGLAAAAAGGKRTRIDAWSEDDSDEPAPAAPALRGRAYAQVSAPAALAGGAASDSPPSVGLGGGVPGGLRRTSSSRGSDGADESWIEEHADRQPEPAAPISSREEYAAREAAFNAKYDVYFALHQLIEAHKKDFEALAAAQAQARSEAERTRLRRELERLHQRRGERAKRWDQAYRVLHQELSAAKARMSEFVQSLQQHASVAAQQQAGSAAIPAVRVK